MFESNFNDKKPDFESEKTSPVSDERLEYIRKNQERIAKRLIEHSTEKIGYGNSSEVYIDPKYPDLCYKIITDGRNVNTPSKEAVFLEQVRDIDSEIKTPLPIMVFSYDYEENGEKLTCSAMAMERINGMTLDEISTERKFPQGMAPETKQDILEFRESFKQIRKLVADMNEQLGIYHNDLKERNIMIDEDGEWWLIDFGEAKEEYMQEEVSNSDSQDLKRTWSNFSLFLQGYVEGLQKD